LHDHVIAPVGRQAYCVRLKCFVGKERAKLLSLQEHQNVILFGVYGDDRKRDRLVGYCLMFMGAPIIHRFTRYCSFSYSEPTDIRYRQVKVIYNDEFVRLLRLGVGTFEYFLVCRKSTDEQLQTGAADAATHLQFSGTWKDGM
jgi:hypothetical protein